LRNRETCVQSPLLGILDVSICARCPLIAVPRLLDYPRFTETFSRVRRFLQIALVLLLLTFGGGSWYLYRKGLSQSWRELVVAELRERGAEVSFGSLTVEPFRGLIAHDVKVYASRERKLVLARVNELVVEANYARAARGEPFLEALTLVDAALRLPIDPKKPDGPAVLVEKLNTRILLQPRCS
jgi:hypothetical protein